MFYRGRLAVDYRPWFLVTDLLAQTSLLADIRSTDAKLILEWIAISNIPDVALESILSRF